MQTTPRGCVRSSGRTPGGDGSTQVVGVGSGRLLDVVPGRDAMEPCRWFAGQPDGWRAGIAWATLDRSASYRTVLDAAVQVAEPFQGSTR
jgi:hypothetical protein